MGSELIVKNLYFKDILKDINFSLKESSINVLMGKNSSGKTLLLKSIFGLVEYNGLVSFNGTVQTNDNVEDFRRNVGIYLGLNTLENKTVFLNMIEPLNNLNYDINEAKKKVYEISKKLGIENLLYKEVNTLSHSQKKIVSFAQIIIHKPKVILIDGLFDSLDIYYKNKIVAHLKKLKKSNKSIILFTTNNSEDLCLADNLLIIKNGKIVVNDNIDNLIQDENLFSKNDIKLPFLVDLSYKLKAYDLIDRLIYDADEMVDEIWQ